MKRILITIILSLCISAYSSAANPAQVVVSANTAVNNFALYPTVNVYTFLKLDTRNGRIWQVQYSMDDDEFEISLNDKSLVNNG